MAEVRERGQLALLLLLQVLLEDGQRTRNNSELVGIFFLASDPLGEVPLREQEARHLPVE